MSPAGNGTAPGSATGDQGSEAAGSGGFAAAGSPRAAQTAAAILAAGGTAVDAAIAASAVQCVAELAWCGLGGDAFLLVHSPGDDVVALNGSGAAPRRAADGLDGLRRVPRFGPLSVAVPGLVSAWDLAHQRYGRLPFPALLEPAAALAADGFIPDHRLSSAIAAVEQDAAGFAALTALLSRRDGGRIALPDLAATLTEIGRGGAAYFYRGEFARQMAAHLRSRDGVLSTADMRAHAIGWSRPLSVSYRGHTIYENPPPSMGSALLAELRIFEQCESGRLAPGSTELIDLMVRCKMAAFADTFAANGGPGIAAKLSSTRARWWSDHLPARTAPRAAAPRGGPDTTCLAVRDADGMTVTMIHSLFNSFGSREVVADTGVILNDRLASLAVPGGGPVTGPLLVPGRRPLHTLNTYLVMRGGDVVIAGATPGGRGQVQTSFQVLINLIDKGMTPLDAVSAPRWVHGTPRTSVDDGVLYLEAGHGEQTAAGLADQGYNVRLTPGDSGLADDMFGSVTAVGSLGSGGSAGSYAVADGRRGSAVRGA